MPGSSDVLLKVGLDLRNLSSHVAKIQQALAKTGISPQQVSNMQSFTDAIKQMPLMYPAAQKGTQEFKNYAAQVDKLGYKFVKVGDQMMMTPKHIDKINSATKRSIVSVLKWAIGWTAMYSVLRGVMNFMSGIPRVFGDVEYALAEIQVVSGATGQELDSLRKSAFELGTSLGGNINDIIGSMKLWAQQGKTISETQELTTAAMIGSRVTGESMVKVVDNLTAALNVYNIEAKDSITIIDKWIAVAAKHAITSAELASGLEYVGSTAKLVGFNIEELMGVLTAAKVRTRREISSIGNAFRTVFTRMVRPATLGLIQDLIDIPVFMDKSGNATFRQTQMLRDMSDVLDYIAARWDNLSDAQQFNLGMQVAGVRRMDIFIATMENYTEAIKARIDAELSSGKAIDAVSRLQDTYKVKMESLSNSIKELQYAIADAGVVDFLTALVIWLKKASKGFADFLQLSHLVPDDLKKIASELRKTFQIREHENLQKGIISVASEFKKMYIIFKDTGKGGEALDYMIERLNEHLQSGLTSANGYNDAYIKMNDVISNANQEIEKSIKKRIREQILQEQGSKYLSDAYELQRKLSKLKQLKGVEGVLQERFERDKAEMIISLNKQIEEQRQSIGDKVEEQYRIEMQGKKLLEDKLNIQKDYAALQEEMKENARFELSILEISGVKGVQLAKEKLRLAIENGTVMLDSVDHLRMQHEITEEIVKEMYELASVLQSQVESSIFDIIKGTATWKDLLSDVMDTIMKDQISQVFDKMESKFGVFKGLSKSLKGPIENQHIEGITAGTDVLKRAMDDSFVVGSDTVYRKIVQAFQESQVKAAAAGGAGGDKGGILDTAKSLFDVVADLGSNKATTMAQEASSMFGAVPSGTSDLAKELGGMFGKTPGSSSSMAHQLTNIAGDSGAKASMAASKGGNFLSGAASAAGNVLGAAGAVYGAYKSGSPISGAISGAVAGSMILPGIGTAIGAAVGAIAGALGGKSKEGTIDVKESMKQNTSQIQITNKKLDVLNRNMSAVKDKMQPYALPESYYFSAETARGWIK